MTKRKKADPHESASSTLIRLVQEEHAVFFRTGDRDPYVTVPINGHEETYPIRSTAFRTYLRRRFFDEKGLAPHAQGLADAVEQCASFALFDGHQQDVSVRVAELNGEAYLDLGDEDWSAVKITADGWRVADGVPVRFRRPRGMLALPRPVRKRGVTLERFKRHLPPLSEADFILLLAWLLAAIRPRGPYPMLVLTGEHGTAKSTTERLLRTLIDPTQLNEQSPPRTEHDLVIRASNSHVLLFGNISHVSDWLSDGLSRLATGGGYATRKLYEDDEEKLFTAQRPIAVNGIASSITRPDLLDRAITVDLQPIPEVKRKPESEVLAAFDADWPALLAALLDVVVVGLRELPQTRLSRLPRMADFALWVAACEPACPWTAGAFMRAYRQNRDEAIEVLLEDTLVAVTLRQFMEARNDWEGTMSELLGWLTRQPMYDPQRPPKDWPRSGRGLSNALRRLAPGLRQVGVTIEYLPRSSKGGSRTVRIVRTVRSPHETGADPSDDTNSQSSVSSEPSEHRASKTGPSDDTDGSDGPLHMFSKKRRTRADEPHFDPHEAFLPRKEEP